MRRGGGAGAGGLRRAVAALVVDQHDAEIARIILRQQRADALRDDVGLVARGDHGDDLGPDLRRGRRGRIVAVAAQPESASAQRQEQPCRQNQKPERAHAIMPFSRNQVMASATAWVQGRAE